MDHSVPLEGRYVLSYQGCMYSGVSVHVCVCVCSITYIATIGKLLATG